MFYLLNTRFVVTRKGYGDVKAWFGVRGFEEDSPKSDSPTASRDTFKVFFAILANEKWEIEGSDVRADFLQTEKLSRTVYIQPPKERRKDGIIWKLVKPVYGLKDASQCWFESIVKT